MFNIMIRDSGKPTI